ncbi:helix-turn-helix transcriptional regulator [Bauldia litoralis]|uniref:Helix-turn-helix domain-containing protein n=1 Tax=Bauldia litoralis TaxID=665467 RepID=A0A1G6DPZ1_9HYPH|nr:helix-turn-helix domain-containing protein [Bauldia litoralis]SDB47209.1 hypothetical protein SAMN02982931_03608 [Bauldia litoralis]
MTSDDIYSIEGVAHLTQSDVSRRWRLSPRTLERWRYLGVGLPYLKLGGRVLYRLADVEAFEVERERRARTPPAGDCQSRTGI